MGDAVLIILIIALIMFIAGIVMSIFTIRFVKRKEHTILSILFSVLICPCINIPVYLIIGFAIARILAGVTIIFALVMIILSVKNVRKN